VGQGFTVKYGQGKEIQLKATYWRISITG
jgi:hypothetical protein